MRQFLMILLLFIIVFNVVANDTLLKSPIHSEQKSHFIIAAIATAASIIFSTQLVIRANDIRGIMTFTPLLQISTFIAINNWSMTYSPSSNIYYSYHDIGDDIKFTFINSFSEKEQDIIQLHAYLNVDEFIPEEYLKTQVEEENNVVD